MVLKLHYSQRSPASRASLLTILALDIDAELVPVNLAEQENLTTDFLELNPFHTVPTLQDDNFTLWDSHAINVYLVEKYGKDDSLYPKDLQKRATVNQRLHFDSGVLQSRMQTITVSIMKEGARSVAKDKADALTQGYNFLETLLEKKRFVAGSHLTIADFNIVATITSANVLVPLAFNRFPKIFEWLNRMESLPYYKKGNQEGLDEFIATMKSKLGKL